MRSMASLLRALGLAAGLAATADGSKVLSQTQALASNQALRKISSMVRGGGFVRSFGFKHKLRICNAYAYDSPLDIFHGDRETLTGSAPLAYKECRDFDAPLVEGDKLDFKADGVSTGTFSIEELPNNDAILLLIIYPHDTQTAAVAFKSHVFANVNNVAQLAVINVFKGQATSTPHIVGTPPGGNTTVTEELRFDSVVAVNGGDYEIRLQRADGGVAASKQLNAVGRESYVILRTGLQADSPDLKSYPEDIVIFPKGASAWLHSRAMGAQRSVAVLAGALAIAVAAMACSA